MRAQTFLASGLTLFLVACNGAPAASSPTGVGAADGSAPEARPPAVTAVPDASTAARSGDTAPCQVSFNTLPPSEARVDDRVVGKTPIPRLEVSAGAHTVHFAGGGSTKSVPFTCTGGRARTIAVDLRTGVVQPEGPHDAGRDPLSLPF